MEDEQYLTFDDVLIVPAYSDIASRQEIDTSVDFLGHSLGVPIISANMDFVTGSEMVHAMYKNGGLGILHRFWDSETAYLDALGEVVAAGDPLWFSVGIRDPRATLDLVKRVAALYHIDGICIDVAHGHHTGVAEVIELIKGSASQEIAAIKVIAGNVATIEGAAFLQEHGADAVKVGIGAGSVCTTRTVAGVGVPQWSAIFECASIKEEYPDLIVIADGGIRTSGDIAKALAAGADVVMLGNMLAGTDEAPGELLQPHEGDTVLYKRYRGQASFGTNGERYVKEGIEGLIPYKGPVAPVLQQIKAGLQSSMSYVGARTLAEFADKSQVVKVSSHTLMENNTRVREV